MDLRGIVQGERNPSLKVHTNSVYMDGMLGNNKAIGSENRPVVAKDWGEGMSDIKRVAPGNSSGCWNWSISCESYKNLGMLHYGIYKITESQYCTPEMIMIF